MDSQISASDSNLEQFPTRFLSPKETINIAINEQNPLKEIPHGEKSKQAYVIDKRHMPSDARGTVFYDDCGHYGKSNGHTYHLLKPTLVNIFFKGNAYIKKVKGKEEQITPIPDENDVIHIFERTTVLKNQQNFKRKIYTFRVSDGSNLNHLAVVQYRGTLRILI